MANIKSKVKNIAKIEQARKRNSAVKSQVKKAIRKAREATYTNDENASKKVIEAKSLIAKAVQKGVFHPNKGSRKQSRLDKFVNQQIASK